MWLLILCILWQRNSPLNRLFPWRHWSLWLSSAVGLCSVSDVISVCISPAIVLLLRQSWGLQYPLWLLSQSCLCCYLVLPHRIPEEPHWPAFPCWISKSSSSVLVFGAVGNLAFQSHGRTLKLVRGESGSWTQLGLHCLSSWPLLCSLISSLSHIHSPRFFFLPPLHSLSSNFF